MWLRMKKKFSGEINMNTGEKNTLGRTIFKGPKGGTYVLSGTKKVYTFKKAPAAAPVSPKSVTYNGKRYVKTNLTTMNGALIYKGNGNRHFTFRPGIGRNFVPEHTRVKNTSGTVKPLKNHVAPAPAPAGTPPIPGFTKTNYKTFVNSLPVYRKNSTGRYYRRIPSTGVMGAIHREYAVVNSSGTKKKLGEFLKGAVAKPKTTNKLPTPSPRVRITTVERNRRLAEIRASLNAIKAKILVEKPKSRAEIEQKLRLALRRTRARLNPTRENLAGKPTQRITIEMCHASASVPRQKCTVRKIQLENVYTGDNPLIDSGGVVAMQTKDFDLDWFKRQNAYISKLSDYDFWTVQAHTNTSHTWIGPYTYKGAIPRFNALGDSRTHIQPLWPQIRKMILDGTYYQETEQWIQVFKAPTTSETFRYDLYTKNITRLPVHVKRQALELYKKDLKRIIAGAPRAHKKMILYRGSSFDIFQGTRGHWYTLKSFCSSSYNVENAAAGYGHTFTRITVLPGTPVLFVAGTNQWGYAGEYEVMVNIDTKYLIRARGVRRHVYYAGRRRNSAHYPYKVTDVVIAK